jgi:hypothetical protein
MSKILKIDDYFKRVTSSIKTTLSTPSSSSPTSSVVCQPDATVVAEFPSPSYSSVTLLTTTSAEITLTAAANIVQLESNSSAIGNSVHSNVSGNTFPWAQYRSEKRGGKDARRIISCRICREYPDVVSILCKTRPPTICTDIGIVYRESEAVKHEHTEYHKAAASREKIDHARKDGDIAASQGAVQKMFSKASAALAEKVGRLMLTVFNDAKRGTLSAFSWPSRMIAHTMGNSLDLEQKHERFQPTDFDLQYVNPVNHRQMLDSIVKADIPTLRKTFENVLAMSLRVDGSVDRMQVDNKHVLCKIVHENGDEKTVFVGFHSPEERGVTGYVDAVKKSVQQLSVEWEEFFPKVSSIVTDGESLNRGPFWRALQEMREQDPNSNIPLMKIWCSAHRSQLAFSDMSKSVIEVQYVLQDCREIVKFYHSSGLRTKELHRISTEMNVVCKRLPEVHDIRFAEYTDTLLTAVLCNWNVMLRHWEVRKEEEKDVIGFTRKWMQRDQIWLACILRDVLYLYSRFQKALQGDGVTVFDLESLRDRTVKRLDDMLGTPLPGGEEAKLAEKNYMEFQGIILETPTQKRQKSHHLFVSQKRDLVAVRIEVISSLRNFLTTRLSTENPIPLGGGGGMLSQPLEKVLACLKPERILEGGATVEELSMAFSFIAPDLSQRDLHSSYKEVQHILTSENTRSLQSTIKVLLANEDWKPLAIALARILAAKPHSMDVERCISAYNELKDSDRTCLSASTMQNYLYVKMNMPPLACFDVRPAVLHWMNLKDRRPHQINRGSEQEWFIGVFPEARRDKKDDICM